jgi:hypothetical protein
MTDPTRATPGDDRSEPLAALAAIAEALEQPAGRITFIRGLTVGALAGAALVGAVFQLRRSTRRRPHRP